jgi:dipeptidyl aminopeptidase/acylaminoacyl peptidase
VPLPPIFLSLMFSSESMRLMKFLRAHSLLLSLLIGVAFAAAGAQTQTKPPITLDEFMNATEITGQRISPDGSAVVICTVAPDWQQNRFKQDLWLWTKLSGATKQLTHAGHDWSPQWSPDGKTIAFVSDHALPGDVAGAEGDGAAEGTKDEPSRVWLISILGGEALPLYREKLDVHAFGWSSDGASIVFSVTEALSKDAEDAHKAEWKDVIRWREHERGDVLLSLPVAVALEAMVKTPEAHQEPKPAADKPEYPAGAVVVTHSALEITEIVASPDRQSIAFETGPVSHRLEKPAESEVFLVAAKGGDARQLTHNEGLEEELHWSPSGKSIFLLVRGGAGSIEGPYSDVQGRIYSLDVATGAATRLGAEFQGSWENLVVLPDGALLVAGLKGVEQAIYRVDADKVNVVATLPGHYAHLDVARNAGTILFTHSRITEPTQAYIAMSVAALNEAKPVTAFNPVFADRAQVEWKPYRWKSTDGTDVEGVLIYPPGKLGDKHLRMLTLIHGGPEDADGNRFGADWYDWATYAASNGWLVFRPNYRGSTGYGDKFMLAIMPHLVSAPGLDILSGVDALVKDGIADPDHLTIGGYSYGGYMTNWLITQTTRFKAAVTGAGAVEHAANWGNDDLTWDDAWYLSGTPWEKPDLYQREAALFQMNKVKTPTHIVGGNADNRVSYFEQVLLERALQRLNVPHTLLVFPGENHPLDKNPWHGYIKVREELKWLDTYGAN